jgi:hypothetical protein
MNDTNYILCFYFCVQGLAVGKHSACVGQCMDYTNGQLEGCVQPTFCQRLILYLLNIHAEQDGSSYFLCNIHTLIFSNKTYRTHFPYTSYEFLVTTCCLYRLPICPETN